MNQGGVKNATAEPTRLDNKRERRRGAAGRAAALRRAPSDSDCSGETASLSADSGDRAVRSAPPPARSGKSRSRRRGSEWEVLEGLKDGQRFEKRPDVFNGYLHKKRKWPLKGWHKRFFVIDGGILVYARSPTDVARGRLHGSVDVGLSVISAKARRRRIDIDADEFIYHLRAKTPDIFRTWLNVLKAHRLYRQHLLTFGARESIPKIHAPLDDLPATDTSSRTSHTSTPSEEAQDSPILLSLSPPQASCDMDSSLIDWQATSSSKSELIPLSFDALDETKTFDLKDTPKHNPMSMCSMNCVARRFDKMNLKRKMSPDWSLGSTDAEKQMHSTELNLFRSPNPCPQMSLTNNFNNQERNAEHFSCHTTQPDNKKQSLCQDSKLPSTTACFFFTRKKNRFDRTEAFMRKSKKSTNLVKYKNSIEEPLLKRPLSACMLLGKNKSKMPKPLYIKRRLKYQTIVKESNDGHNKTVKDVVTGSELDKITDKLMVSIFQNLKGTVQNDDVKSYVNDVVKYLYDSKFNSDLHPVKALFKSLLEYWLENTSRSKFKEAMTSVKSIDKQSKDYSTKDQNVAGFLDSHGANDLNTPYKTNTKASTNNKQIAEVTKTDKNKLQNCSSPKCGSESFEKEKRIQNLERLLKNTIYFCDTARSKQSREKDIKITKTLIGNLERVSKQSALEKSNENANKNENSSSSTEVPKIKETIDHLISETSLPPAVAKEILSVYLDVLMEGSNKSITISQSSEHSADSIDNIACDVETESVIKKVSKSVTTLKVSDNTANKNTVGKNKTEQENLQPVDPGQLYLKDILEKITTIFSKVKKFDDKIWPKEPPKQNTQSGDDKITGTMKDELGRPVKEYSGKKMIYENYEENSLVIDLSKYNLEHISMLNDPNVKGKLSITVQLKEKPLNDVETVPKQLSFRFSDAKPDVAVRNKSENLLSILGNRDPLSDDIFNRHSLNKSKIPFIDFNSNKDIVDLKPYLSSSDATSKCYKVVHESEHSLDLSFKTSNSSLSTDLISESKEKKETQSCYIMSIKKGNLPMKNKIKKTVRLKESNALVLGTSRTSRSPTRPLEYSVFEKPTPRIIDEKFILLLLENLTSLSKNIPSLYKDINNLYLKLKKKHDKVVKLCGNIQGLSLLGKIYNDESINRATNENETQFDVKIYSENATDPIDKNTVSFATNTSKFLVDKHFIDKSLSAYAVTKNLISSVVQTEGQTIKVTPLHVDNVPSKDMTSTKQTACVDHSLNELDITRQGTSNQSWFNKICMRDCAISTILDCVLKNESTHNFRIAQRAVPIREGTEHLNRGSSQFRMSHPVAHIRIEREPISKKKKQSAKVRQDLIKQISLLSPSFKVSTESQTDRQLIRYLNEKKAGKKFDVYQIYMSSKFDRTKSSSMSEMNLKIDRSDDLKTLYRCTSDPSFSSGVISPTSPGARGPQAGFVCGTPGGRLAGWIIESGGPLENASRELGQAQLSVQQLQRLLDALELQHQAHHDTDVSLEGASPNVKKDRRKFGLRKKKSNSKCASVELAPSHIDPSSSHTALSALTAPPSPGGCAGGGPGSAASLPIACAAARPQSLPGAEALGAAPGPASLTSLTPDHQLREDFTVLAKDLVANLKTIVSTLVCERGRLRAAMEAADSTSTGGGGGGGGVVAALRTNLSSALQQNSELRSRLSRIHDASDLAELSSPGNNSDPANRQFQQSLSYSSSCVSASEFFDAEEHEDDLKPDELIAADEAGVIELDGDSSSEAGSLSSEEGSASSDNSDVLSAEQVTLRLNVNGAGAEPGEGEVEGGEGGAGGWRRRTRLPAPRPTPGGPSLWNLLYKNIGKDLSQISMPVTINEPLNMLQRLCEELEYSELLDMAARCAAAAERAALVGAFAVSAYAAAAHRAASKPFNPLLAETYECVRPDRGFRFLAEQVSHHPPISACHAESPRWVFWQEARIKTKFWGKSMEFQPTGRVHVRLLPSGDHYSWNKVTTCVHNLFGGQRWVDQYGDMHITCHGTDITCKLNFVKASSWSSSRHEVRGVVSEPSSGTRLRLTGRWSEALHLGDPPAARCLWRPGAMPPDHELYYGFTRFAMELNEMEPGMEEVLPHTDTRFRPDQRALEAGEVAAAERHKLALEQAQRDRRRDAAHHVPAWFRKTVEEGEETWVFSGEYWKAREASFPALLAPRIW